MRGPKPAEGCVRVGLHTRSLIRTTARPGVMPSASSASDARRPCRHRPHLRLSATGRARTARTSWTVRYRRLLAGPSRRGRRATRATDIAQVGLLLPPAGSSWHGSDHRAQLGGWHVASGVVRVDRHHEVVAAVLDCSGQPGRTDPPALVTAQPGSPRQSITLSATCAYSP